MFIRPGPFFIGLFSILILAAAAPAQLSIPGQVIDVIDGKTVIVAIPTGKVNVELQYINVPGPDQQMHDVVKGHLRDLVIGKMVEYRPKMIFNDRTIGRLMLNRSVDVSQQMLRDGAAWLIPAQISGQEKGEYDLYASTEAAAKNEKRGVWLMPRPPQLTSEARVQKSEEPKPDQIPSALNSSTKTKRRSGYWGDTNPALGNIGALVNGYNAESKTGYVGTSMLGLEEMNKELDQRMAIDVTYFYKEDEKNGRKGMFVITLASFGKKEWFLTNNDLVVTGDGKTIKIGKAKRTVSKNGEAVREDLVYQIDRATISRIINSDYVVMKVGEHLVQLTGLRYMLYNMLQISQ